MNAIAHQSALTTFDEGIDLWPDDPDEDTAKLALSQSAVVAAAIGVALVGLLIAIVLQTTYHALILLWIWFGLPLLFAARAIARIGAAGVDRVRVWQTRAGHESSEALRRDVGLYVR